MQVTIKNSTHEKRIHQGEKIWFKTFKKNTQSPYFRNSCVADLENNHLIVAVESPSAKRFMDSWNCLITNMLNDTLSKQKKWDLKTKKITFESIYILDYEKIKLNEFGKKI